MACYRITYHDKWGTHEAFKWGNSPEEALQSLKAAHRKARRPAATYDPPVLLAPQPFEIRKPVEPRESIGPQIELHAPDEEPELNPSEEE